MMKSAREVAAEMVPAPGSGQHTCSVCIEDTEDYVPLEPQASPEEALAIIRDARGIIERLVTREREPLMAVLREVADELMRARLREPSMLEIDRMKKVLAKAEAALKEDT